MTINSVLSVGVQGVQKGFAQADRAALDIARLSTGSGDTVDLPKSLVDLKASEIQVKASAEVIKTADETIGTLIDIRA